MATATKSQNKTSFVKEFLHDNPQGNVQAVNAAWAAAKMNGTIGATLINKMRSEMGLTGNLRAASKPGTTARPKSATKMSKSGSSPGKTMFAKEFLNDHPHSNVDAVNDAWQLADFDGTINPTLAPADESKVGSDGEPSREYQEARDIRNREETGQTSYGDQRRGQRATTRQPVRSSRGFGSRHRSAYF